MKNPIADLHCHPSLKPSNNSKIKNIWKYRRNLYTKALFKGFLGIAPRRWLVDSFARNLAKHTQSNLDSCYEGDNRLLVLAIYPIERPFLKPNRPFKKSTKFQKIILNAVFGEKLNKSVDNKIIRILTGFSKQKIDEYLKSISTLEKVNYFQDYINEYNYIRNAHVSNSDNEELIYNPSFRLIKDFEELKKIKSRHIIAGILSIEGMHALANYRRDSLFNGITIDGLPTTEKKDLENSYINNIQTLKDVTKFEYTPFFITFSHHFNNLIAGHAKSFADAKNSAIPGFSDVFDQQNGLDLGFTKFAKTLIKDHLLSRGNGARILIDTKHMSLKCRTEYAEIVKEYREKGDMIPIICSHTAINGIPTRAAAALRSDTNRLDEKSYISRWDINVTDEDIVEIFDSDGIVGICMHDGRMPGGKFKKMLKDFKKGMYNNRESVSRLHAQMFLTNIFHTAKINLQHIRNLNKKNTTKIDEKEAWKTICLGSDNDGIIDPFDHYNKASSLDEFKNRLSKAIKLNFIPTMKNFRILSVQTNACIFYTKQELTDIMVGYTAEEIIDEVFSKNLMVFLSKYFSKNYLHKTNT